MSGVLSLLPGGESRHNPLTQSGAWGSCRPRKVGRSRRALKTVSKPYSLGALRQRVVNDMTMMFIFLMFVFGTWHTAWAQPSFYVFESGHVRPLALSPDGSRLYAVNTPDNRREPGNGRGRLQGGGNSVQYGRQSADWGALRLQHRSAQ